MDSLAMIIYDTGTILYLMRFSVEVSHFQSADELWISLNMVNEGAYLSATDLFVIQIYKFHKLFYSKFQANTSSHQ